MRFWFALHVKPSSEPRTIERLNVESYWPHQEITDKSRHTRKRSFFPGYLFARFNPDDPLDYLSVISVPSVLSIVGAGRQPIAISDTEIESLKLMCSQAATLAHPLMKIGDPVRVVRGPLSGAQGFLVRTKGGCRLVVSVDLLGRSVSAEIDADAVEALPFARQNGLPQFSNQYIPGVTR